MIKIKGKHIEKGSIVRLKDGKIVLIDKIDVQLMPHSELAQVTYKGILKDGTQIDININDVIEVLTLLQKIWLLIKGFFKKAEVKKITSDEKNTTPQ